MIQFRCHHCSFETPIGDEYAGKRVRCPKCKGTVQLEASATQEPMETSSGSTSVESSSFSINRKYGLNEFLERTIQKDRQEGVFELESDRILELNLHGEAWIKTGSMIGYRGSVRFVRENILQFGAKRALKKIFTGEGVTLTRATGNGKVYLADQGKKVTLLNLAGETLFVNGSDVLAFEKSLKWDVQFIRQFGAWFAGGLFNVKLSGHGMVAICTHYDPLTLRVTSESPVTTDPTATVAWSGNLSPEFKMDVQLKTFFGRGSGESIQCHFRGDGFVVLQPFEEVRTDAHRSQSGAQSSGGSALIMSLLSAFVALFVALKLLFFRS